MPSRAVYAAASRAQPLQGRSTLAFCYGHGMPKDGHPDEPAILAAFLKRILDDKERGAERSLTDYQRQFPGHEGAIAAEFARLGSGELSGTCVDGTLESECARDRSLIRGSVADRYRDEQEIAAGGMGTIYRVWDPSLERGIAKKVLGSRKQGPGSTAGLVERFLDEAQVTAQLDHPGIVPVHELGIDAAGRVYFTMSLVRGQNFKEIIDLVHRGEDGWTRTRALGVLQRVCEAVAFAHSKGVIHRDLKPANIMVGPFGQTYVLDWGLARVEGQSVRSHGDQGTKSEPASPNLTREGDIVGTPAYMAPEQARGELEAVGPHSDVYAIGAMLYHLLAGRMPYADAGSKTWQAVLDATLSGSPTPLRTLRRDIPEELVAIQERAMNREPGRRYESAQDLGDDLRAFLETRVVRAHRTGAFAELNKWVRRNRLAASAAALALVSLVAGLGTSLWLKGVADASAQRAVLQAEIRQAVLDFLNEDLLAAVAPGAAGKDATMREVLDRAAQGIEGRFPDQPLVEAAVRRTLGDTYRRLGVLDEAERHITRSVALHSEHGGGDAVATLDARRVLAIVYRRQNRLRDAERVDREVLAISREAFGPEHDDTLAAANNLGLVLTYLGERDEAESLLREVYEVRRRKLGVNHDDTLVSMCNLGLLYYNAGRFREAEPLIKGELDLCVAKHGEEDPGTLVSMNNHANLLQAMGRYVEAIQAHERVFRISDKTNGERHPETIGSLLNQARIQFKLERHDRVRELLGEARARSVELGPDHGARLETELLDAELSLAAGDIPAALTATADLLAWHRRVLGDRAMRTLEVWRLRAVAIQEDGRPADSLREIDAAIAAGGDDETLELTKQRILRGRLLVELQQFGPAEVELLAAERYLANNLPEDPDHLAVIDELIDVYDRSGQPDLAAEWRARRQ